MPNTIIIIIYSFNPFFIRNFRKDSLEKEKVSEGISEKKETDIDKSSFFREE